MLQLSPIWEVKQINTDDLAVSSIHKIKKKYCKYSQTKTVIKKTFAKSVAPEQSSVFMNYLSQSEDEEEVSEELNIKFYKN